jgi:uncharacterized protein
VSTEDPPSVPEHRHPRRLDRSRDVVWIEAFLHQGGVAVLAAVRDGRPLCLPRLYVYDQERRALYLHGGHGGELGSVLEGGGGGRNARGGDPGSVPGRGGAGPGVRGGELLNAPMTEEPVPGATLALTVFEMGRLLPADEAAEFSVEFASVVVSGRGVVVEDPHEAMHGLRLLMEKYAPHLQAGDDYRAMAPEEVARASVLRVDIEAWSGKEKTEAEDFPGAYRFGEVTGGGEPSAPRTCAPRGAPGPEARGDG